MAYLRKGGSLLYPPPHGGVPVIFDGIVSATRQQLGDLGPFIAESAVGVEDEAILFGRPGRLLDVGAEMVVPPMRVAVRGDAASGACFECSVRCMC